MIPLFAREALAHTASSLELSRLEYLRTGTHVTYRAHRREQSVIVRIADHADSATARREGYVAERIRATGLHTPTLLARADVPAGYVSVWEEIPHDPTRVISPRELGSLAARLHSFSRPDGPSRLMPHDSLARAAELFDRGEITPSLRTRLEAQLDVTRAALADVEHQPSCLVHGDLHTSNLLRNDALENDALENDALELGDRWTLIDFELSGWGCPMVDLAPSLLAVVRYGTDPVSLDELAAGYGTDLTARCLSAHRAAYELFVVSWTVGFASREPAIAQEAAHRVSSLLGSGPDRTHPRWTLL